MNTGYFYIINPLSFEVQKDPEIVRKLKEKIDSNNSIIGQVHRTFREGDVTNLIKHAINNSNYKVDKIIICGGDETVSEAIQSLSLISSESNIQMGLLPLGRENTLAKHYKISGKSLKLVSKFDEFEPIEIPVSRVNKTAFLEKFEVVFRDEDELIDSESNELTHISMNGKFSISGILRRLIISRSEKFGFEIYFQTRNADGTQISESVFNGKSLKITTPETLPKYVDGAYLKGNRSEEFVIERTSSYISILRP